MRSYFPVELIFGVGTVGTLPEHLSRLGVQRPLVVTDQGIVAAGILTKALDGFADNLAITSTSGCAI